MSTNESQSYATLKAKGFLPRDRVDRIENLTCVPGMPDVNCCCDGVDAWIEIKTPVKTPVRTGTPVMSSAHPLSQEQKNWLMMHAKAGGRGFVYVDAPTRRYLVRGEEADGLNRMTTAEMMLVSDWSAPVPTPNGRWEEFRSCLRGQ